MKRPVWTEMDLWVPGTGMAAVLLMMLIVLQIRAVGERATLWEQTARARSRTLDGDAGAAIRRGAQRDDAGENTGQLSPPDDHLPHSSAACSLRPRAGQQERAQHVRDSESHHVQHVTASLSTLHEP